MNYGLQLKCLTNRYLSTVGAPDLQPSIARTMQTLSGEPLNPDSVGKELRHAINRHGHAFQNAVLARAEALYQDRGSRAKWMFDCVEVPVEVRGQSTRIDILLHQIECDGGAPARFLVAECKRANPALSNWCFARTTYLRRNLEDDRSPFAEHVRYDGTTFSSEPQTLSHGRKVYALGYEVRADHKGDGPPGRGAIEEACGQVLRGVNGFVQLLRTAPHLMRPNRQVPIIPVVFTTANLWITHADLATADLHSGALASDVHVEQAPWLWYRYHMSPGLRHDLPSAGVPHDVGRSVERWFSRGVAIVSPSGIDEFLSTEF
jgi:hypothetical protein